MTALEQCAAEYAGNWMKQSDFGWSGKPEHKPENCGLYYYLNRDSEISAQSNAEQIKEILAGYIGWMDGDGADIEIQTHNHWLCGWVEGLVIRVYDDEGNITPAFDTFYWAVLEPLENYPLLNEEDYCQREYDEQHECIKDNLPELREDLVVDDDLVHEIWDWLWAYDQESLYYGDPGDVKYAGIEEACKELGYLYVEPEPILCPLCDGYSNELGTMGNLTWYRCEDCGADFDIEVEQPVPAFQLQLIEV